MSEILKALKISEQNHQRYGGMSPEPIHFPQGGAVKVSKIAMILSFTTPVILTMSWLGYELLTESQQAREPIAETNVKPDAVTIDSPFLVLADLPEKELKTTNRALKSSLEDLISDDQALVENVELLGSSNMPVEKKAAQEDDIGELSQLDLSQFSPELVKRVQSVLSGDLDGDDPATRTAQVELNPGWKQVDSVKLSQRGADFVGTLPAMNFQTHVYSNVADKRWVTINGSEFTEGEWVNHDVLLMEIRQRYCVIDYKGQRIEVPALFDWKG